MLAAKLNFTEFIKRIGEQKADMFQYNLTPPLATNVLASNNIEPFLLITFITDSDTQIISGRQRR